MATIGILGGGQLARMLAIAGAPLGHRFLVVDSAEDACAAQVAPVLRADWRDFAALEEFASKIDVATFDFENVPAETARMAGRAHARVSESGALAVAQDRLVEKTLFGEIGLDTPIFAAVDSLAELQSRGRQDRSAGRPQDTPPGLRRQGPGHPAPALGYRGGVGGTRWRAA